jgi:putative membrane protein
VVASSTLPTDRCDGATGGSVVYLWAKSLHIVFMVSWFAGLFYLPRLFVYHAMTTDAPGIARFKVMERKLYRGITTPAGLLTLGSGIWLVTIRGSAWFTAASWLHFKLVLVGCLAAYHLYLGHLCRVFARDANRRSHVFYRWINEFPVLVLLGAVFLAEFKPG